jgi:hypothetical protein
MYQFVKTDLIEAFENVGVFAKDQLWNLHEVIDTEEE